MSIQQIFLGTGSADPGEPIEVANSLRFNDDDPAYFKRTPSGAGDQQTWTFSCWVKFTLGSYEYQNIFGVSESTGTWTNLYIYNNGGSRTIRFGDYYWSDFRYQVTNLEFGDPTRWYHVVFSLDSINNTAADRQIMWIDGVRLTPTHNTCTLNATSPINSTNEHNIFREKLISSGMYNDGYLADVHFVDGTALDASSFGLTHATTGQWVPKDCSGDLTYGTNGFYLKFNNTSNLGEDSAGSNDWTVNNLLAIAPNNGATWGDNCTITSATGSNFGPGTIADLFDGQLTSTYVSAYSSGIHSVTMTFDPKLPDGTTIELRGWKGASLTTGCVEVNGTDVSSAIADGTTGAWGDVSAAASGGIETIKLLRQDGVKNPALSAVRVDGDILIDGQNDAPGLDLLIDSPSTHDDGRTGYGVGNYCTLNPTTIGTGGGGTPFTLSEGNLVCTAPGPDGHSRVHSTLYVSSGKFYWEAEYSKAQSSWYYSSIGMVRSDMTLEGETSYLPGYDSVKAFSMYQTAGAYYYDSTSTTAYGPSWGVNDVIGCAWDNGSIYFYKNGVAMNTSSPGTAMLTGLTGSWSPVFHSYKDGEWIVNFGQRPFTYPIPTGYKAINTYNGATT